MKLLKRSLFIILTIFSFIAVSLSLNIRTIASSSTYYNGLSSQYGSTLKSSLRSLISTTHTYITSYDDCKDPAIVKKTDGDPNNSNNIILFWSEISRNGAWDGGTSWNREHVWPQSQGWFTTSGAGADLHHIRPVDMSVNSTHNNHPYGEVSGGSYVKTGTANGSKTTECKYANSVFEPGDDKKGDTARIIFYLLVRYSQSDSYSITNVATSMDLLLEWNNADPVDSSEVRRNEAVYDIQGNRNPFIDNSNYANLIWGGATPDDNPSSGSGSTSGGSSSGVLPTTNLVAIFDFGSKDSTKTDEYTQDGDNTTTYSETYGSYSLSLSNMSRVYQGSYDALGNSCLKIGVSAEIGTFTFSVPSNVDSVVIRVAGYKSNTAAISINGGASQSISTYSANGEYTNVTIDTSSNKTIVFSTLSTGYRCKVDAIAYYSTSGDIELPSYTVEDALNAFTNESTKSSLFLNYDDYSYNYSTTEKYSYTFSSKIYTSQTTKTLDSMNWELENDGGYYGYNSTKGHQIGSANNPATEVIFRTEDMQYGVTSATIYASGANDIVGEISVYVGTRKLGTTKTLTSSNKAYTFTSTTPLDGRVKVRITQTSSVAIYVKSLSFTHTVTNSAEGYSLNYAAMKFGTCIDKNIYETLSEQGATWGVEYYKGTVTDWSNVQSTKVKCTPAQVSQMGDTQTNNNGMFYQFALVLNNISYNDLDTKVSARAYVIIDGVTYYMKSTTYSVRDLVSVYLNSSNGSSYSQYSGIFQHLLYY